MKLLMKWIKEHPGEAIPKELYYNKCQTDRSKDRYELTPLMLWIEYRPGESIPKELYYN